MTARRQLDQFDKFDQNEEVTKVRVARASQEFKDDNPDYCGSPENTRALLAWIANEGLPITRLNLQEAFDQLKAIGDVLEKRPETVFHESKDKSQGDRGIQKITNTVKINFPIGSDAQRSLTGQQPHRMREIMGKEIAEATAHLVELRDSSEIGKPVSKALRYEYGASLRQQRALKSPSKSQVAEARACVGLTHPNVAINSREFNRLVGEILAEAQQ